MIDYKLIKREEQRTSVWSGGTTTELYIFPEDADYGSRNFSFRISSATVEAEESDFTLLPGIWREIMVLEGSMKLIHEERSECFLEKYDTDSFDGGWKTRSIGMVTDFNLMASGSLKGKLERVTIRSRGSMSFGLIQQSEGNKAAYIGIYNLSASNLQIAIDDKKEELNYKDFIIFKEVNEKNILKLSNNSGSDIDIVAVMIFDTVS